MLHLRNGFPTNSESGRIGQPCSYGDDCKTSCVDLRKIQGDAHSDPQSHQSAFKQTRVCPNQQGQGFAPAAPAGAQGRGLIPKLPVFLFSNAQWNSQGVCRPSSQYSGVNLVSLTLSQVQACSPATSAPRWLGLQWGPPWSGPQRFQKN